MAGRFFKHLSSKRVNLKGFTLAEIMIALTLLGVLSAIVIPQVVMNAPDSNRLLLKKAYYNLSKAISDLINDEAVYPSNQSNSALSLVRGFNYTLATSAPTYYTQNKFCFLLSDRMNTVASSCVAQTAAGGAATGTGTFTTSDGMNWSVFNQRSDAVSQTNANALAANNPATTVQFPLCSGTTAVTCAASNYFTTLVTIDVNGAKTPNCATTALSNPAVSACAASTLPDTYQFGIRFDGKINIPATDTNAITILSDPTSNR